MDGRWRIIFDPGLLRYCDSYDLVARTAPQTVEFTSALPYSMRHGSVVRR